MIGKWSQTSVNEAVQLPEAPRDSLGNLYNAGSKAETENAKYEQSGVAKKKSVESSGSQEC